jgi:uncharacterized damage-inducible protein DinB
MTIHVRVHPVISRRLVIAPAFAALAFAGALQAQTQQGADAVAFDAKAAAHIKKEYLTDLDTLHSKLLALANAIPADKYSWRPAAGVRSVSEVFMHVAGEWYHWTPASVGGKAPADFPAARADLMTKLNGLEKVTTKTEVIDQLNKSWAHCRAQLAGADAAKLTGKYDPWKTTIDAAAFAMSGDLHEHLGQLIAYSRSVGVKPPWSK